MSDFSEMHKVGDRFASYLIDNAPDIMMVLDFDLTIRYVTPSVRQVLGYSPEEMTGASLTAYLSPDDGGPVREIFVDAQSESPGGTFELKVWHRDGFWRYMEMHARNLADAPELKGMLVYLRDVTEHKTLQNALAYRAFHDPLTGLPNRQMFINHLEHALSRSARDGSRVTILYVDLNNFKSINDTFGHEVGDRCLMAVGSRLRSCLRSVDTVARFGGDEFTILLEGGRKDEHTQQVMERIAEVFKKPIGFTGYKLQVTASIGAASSNRRLNEVEDLLHAADVAMYRKKKRHSQFSRASERRASAGGFGPSAG